MKGLAAGVPLVCMPMGRDQNDTAARVVHRGAGVRISPTAKAATIRTAVREVLATPSYREGASRIAGALARREGCVDLVETLEGLRAGTRRRRLTDRPARPRPYRNPTKLVLPTSGSGVRVTGCVGWT